jgi:hypothetical protein
MALLEVLEVQCMTLLAVCNSVSYFNINFNPWRMHCRPGYDNHSVRPLSQNLLPTSFIRQK